MPSLNKVMIIGRLGHDPETKYTPDGTPVCRMSVATSETWKDKNGEKQERTEWHRIILWRRLAEICGEYLRKGSLVYIEGKLQTRSWDTDSGEKRYSTEIVANPYGGLQMLDSKRDSGTASRDYYGDPPPERGNQGEATDDDIPF